MNPRPIIWLVDTSILLNVLDIPNRNQHRISVMNNLENRLKNKDTLLLPYAVIVETGNHIAQLAGNHKHSYSIKFVEQIKLALTGESPWIPLKFPTSEDLKTWLDNFPEYAGKGIGFADFSIIKEWEQQKEIFKGYSVKIWSLDGSLQGYES